MSSTGVLLCLLCIIIQALNVGWKQLHAIISFTYRSIYNVCPVQGIVASVKAVPTPGRGFRAGSGTERAAVLRVKVEARLIL